MRKTTVNFIKENEDGSRSCAFDLIQYKVPEGHGTDINKYSGAGRALFQNSYKSLAKELGDGRKNDAASAERIVLEFLNDASMYATESSTAPWNGICCAVSLNHLLWLRGMGRDQEDVESITQEQAKVLIERIKAKYSKGRCVPMTAWPIPRTCYTMINREDTLADPSDLQCLLTAYACVLARKTGLTNREKGEYDIPAVVLQNEARSTAAALMGLMYPKWTIYHKMFIPQPEKEKNVLLRAAAMPVSTGIARTLIMMSMPLDAAAAIAVDMLRNAWPLTVGGMNASEGATLAAQLFAGMTCTMSESYEKSLDKTCYVWTRYYW